MYKEEWAIANTASLGPNFTLLAGSNQRVVSQSALGNASGSSGGWYRYNVGKTASDHMRIDSGLITPPTGTLNAAIGLFLLARLPDTFATGGAAGTYLAASLGTNGSWTMQSVTQTTFTSRASGSIGAITLPGIVSLVAAGPLYMMLWNGQPMSGATWTDATNSIVGVGSTKRNWGVIVQCSANNQQHPALDWASAHDLSGQFLAAA